eukprot:TRINITY_DN51432_c0_g1_i1.p1 TRINITY_DN51432_c0_g1~~TRINITY_DN51432_c0_g1_i1.p1  ORF type:complete len:456 (-),score=82.48 TRINITY_DN51432_c0_g1_i1:246-1613(-)
MATAAAAATTAVVDRTRRISASDDVADSAGSVANVQEVIDDRKGQLPTFAQASSGSGRPGVVRWRVVRAPFGGNLVRSGGNAGRRIWEGRAPLGSVDDVAGGGTQAKLRVAKLEDEVHSIREAYARKIASTELRAEQMVFDKEHEMLQWFKEKAYEQQKMQASVVIMRAIMEKKRARLFEQMETDRCRFEESKAGFEQDIVRVEERARQDVENATTLLKTKCAEYDDRIGLLNSEKKELEGIIVHLREKAEQEQRQIIRLTSEVEDQGHSIKDLQRQLAEAKQEDKVAQKTRQIEELEAELKRTRKHLHKQYQAEAESLQKELMDYVRFIVNILPDDWQDQKAMPISNGGSEGGFGSRTSAAAMGWTLPVALRERITERMSKGRNSGGDIGNGAVACPAGTLMDSPFSPRRDVGTLPRVTVQQSPRSPPRSAGSCGYRWAPLTSRSVGATSRRTR